MLLLRPPQTITLTFGCSYTKSAASNTSLQKPNGVLESSICQVPLRVSWSKVNEACLIQDSGRKSAIELGEHWSVRLSFQPRMNHFCTNIITKLDPSSPASCVLGSPLQEDSLAGSPYVLSVSSPERSPSSLPSPSSRHLIYRNDHDLREPEDDPHTVRTPQFCVPVKEGLEAIVIHPDLLRRA